MGYRRLGLGSALTRSTSPAPLAEGRSILTRRDVMAITSAPKSAGVHAPLIVSLHASRQVINARSEFRRASLFYASSATRAKGSRYRAR